MSFKLDRKASSTAFGANSPEYGSARHMKRHVSVFTDSAMALPPYHSLSCFFALKFEVSMKPTKNAMPVKSALSDLFSDVVTETAEDRKSTRLNSSHVSI